VQLGFEIAYLTRQKISRPLFAKEGLIQASVYSHAKGYLLRVKSLRVGTRLSALDSI